MDNVPSHFPEVELQCIKVYHLPPNTTSHLQPLHAGIIRAFKAYYRSHQVRRLIELIENDEKPDINLKEAVRFLAMAWKSISPTTIYNCWKHTGILPESGAGVHQVQQDPMGNLTTLLNHPHLRRAECLSAESYLDQDQTLETGDLPTDDDILSLVDRREPDNDDSGSDDEPEYAHNPPTPTSQQAIKAVRVLQSYFDSKGSEEGTWALVGIEKNVQQLTAQNQVQSSLLNVFQRNWTDILCAILLCVHVIVVFHIIYTLRFCCHSNCEL